jgi:hypothetical protein
MKAASACRTVLWDAVAEQMTVRRVAEFVRIQEYTG